MTTAEINAPSYPFGVTLAHTAACDRESIVALLFKHAESSGRHPIALVQARISRARIARGLAHCFACSSFSAR